MALKKYKKASSGIALIEAALTLPVYILIIFFLIDAARYLLVTVWLHYMAYVAVDNFSKSPEAAIYTDLASCQMSPANTKLCADFKIKLADIKTQIADKMMYISGGVTFHTFRMHSGTPNVAFDSELALIRPGEEVLDLTTNELIQHPLRSPGGCDPLKNMGTPCTSRGESWPSVLNSNQLMSLMIVDMQTITPVFFKNSFTIRGMQLGIWRGQPPGRGTSGPTEPPFPTPTNSSTPTFTNTPTVTNTPTETPTETPTVTVTSTETPTVTPKTTPSFTPGFDQACIPPSHDSHPRCDECRNNRGIVMRCTFPGPGNIHSYNMPSVGFYFEGSANDDRAKYCCLASTFTDVQGNVYHGQVQNHRVIFNVCCDGINGGCISSNSTCRGNDGTCTRGPLGCRCSNNPGKACGCAPNRVLNCPG